MFHCLKHAFLRDHRQSGLGVNYSSYSEGNFVVSLIWGGITRDIRVSELLVLLILDFMLLLLVMQSLIQSTNPEHLFWVFCSVNWMCIQILSVCSGCLAQCTECVFKSWVYVLGVLLGVLNVYSNPECVFWVFSSVYRMCIQILSVCSGDV